MLRLEAIGGVIGRFFDSRSEAYRQKINDQLGLIDPGLLSTKMEVCRELNRAARQLRATDGLLQQEILSDHALNLAERFVAIQSR